MASVSTQRRRTTLNAGLIPGSERAFWYFLRVIHYPSSHRSLLVHYLQRNASNLLRGANGRANGWLYWKPRILWIDWSMHV